MVFPISPPQHAPAAVSVETSLPAWYFKVHPERRSAMNPTDFLEVGIDIDPIEEMRLRAWARRHYAPRDQRDTAWHPVVLDEMRRKDRELSA